MSEAMRVGQEKTVTYRRVWRDCEQCHDFPAAWRFTFLLENARRNPKSSAYGRDDCSWCSDTDVYVCRVCAPANGRGFPIPICAPPGYVQCSTFPLRKFKHMGFEWKKIKEEKK